MDQARHLFIVASDLGDLCAYLQREFSAEENVQVFLDRRLGERRSGRDRRLEPRSGEVKDRRASVRRVRAFVETQLRSVGYAMLMCLS
jgi:hypothetical protein